MNAAQQWMNGRALATALGLGEWTIYGVKKANRIFAQQGREALIFTGRLSTPAKVAQWLEAHPDFVARHVLVPAKDLAEPAHQPRPQHQAA